MKKEEWQNAFQLFIGSVIFFALQFAFYLIGSTTLELMDMWGYLFFAASCISHAATFALIPFLLFAIAYVVGFRKIGTFLQVVVILFFGLLNLLNLQVYSLYRFHINGMILNMFFGPGAGDIFTFNSFLLLKETALFLLIIAIVLGMFYGIRRLGKSLHKAHVKPTITLLLAATLFAHGTHIWGSFVAHTSIVQSAKLLPYYFPTTAYSFMMKLGVTPHQNHDLQRGGSGTIQYPLHPLQVERPQQLYNIVFILIDSWNKRSLTPDCMPNIYRFARENQWYTNHVSASNGTRSGVFGLFFGLTCYYWEDFESSHVSPALMDRLQALDYQINMYPSASLRNPNFAGVLFQKIPNLRTETQGKTPYERDRQLTVDFLNDLQQRRQGDKPFFSLLFYDLPHSFELPDSLNHRFTPAWEYADYTQLSNDMNPTPFFNLYRNCCYQVDTFVGKVIESLRQQHMLEHTIIVISGDHGQEFNENKRNYWGHNGNFSTWQIGTPFICHFPQQAPAIIRYRTTHYDLVPTLMHDYFGVKNPIGDYSMGRLLQDSTSRDWHVVGSNLNYAFILRGDTIIEKNAGGGLDVYDARMKPIPDYRIDTKTFNQAIQQLNRFYR